jgi:hypothetical protein
VRLGTGKKDQTRRFVAGTRRQRISARRLTQDLS